MPHKIVQGFIEINFNALGIAEKVRYSIMGASAPLAPTVLNGRQVLSIIVAGKLF